MLDKNLFDDMNETASAAQADPSDRGLQNAAFQAHARYMALLDMENKSMQQQRELELRKTNAEVFARDADSLANFAAKTESRPEKSLSIGESALAIISLIFLMVFSAPLAVLAIGAYGANRALENQDKQSRLVQRNNLLTNRLVRNRDFHETLPLQNSYKVTCNHNAYSKETKVIKEEKAPTEVKKPQTSWCERGEAHIKLCRERHFKGCNFCESQVNICKTT